MVAPTRCATRDELRRLLDNSIGPSDQEHWTEHIGKCGQCSSILTSIAAPDSLWQESREHFSIDETELASAAEPPSHETRLAHYQVEGVVGYGGMATVYRGYDPQLHRAVAIKVLHPHLAKAGNSRQRFLREAQSAAAITHPNVIPIFGVHQEDGKTFLVMPLISNGSLQHRIDRDGPLSLEDSLRIGLQIAEALAAAHASGVIHRDVKPANILLEDGDKRVVLSDFGLARTLDDASITASGLIAGTPAYMSPEQARGDAVDFRTDLFSLGSVLYAMVTGHSPFQASSTLKLLREVSDSPFQSVHRYQEQLPVWVDSMIARFTALSPNDRVANATEAAELIRSCLFHVTNPTNLLPRSLVKPKAGYQLRLRWSLGLSLFACIALIAVYFTSRPSVPAVGSQNVTQTSNHFASDQKRNLEFNWDDPLSLEIRRLNEELDDFLRRNNLFKSSVPIDRTIDPADTSPSR